MTEHEKNEDRFRGQGVALGLEHVDLNHLGSGVDRAVDLLPEGNYISFLFCKSLRYVSVTLTFCHP